MGDLVLLIELAPKLEPPIEYKALNRLSNREGNDFPKIKRRIGQHKFYDADQVTEWYGLWKRANGNRGRRPNAQRKERRGR